MYLNRIFSIFLNITVLSRLIHNLTVILFVFALGFLLKEEVVNKIFTALAIIQMAASFMSFGFGANIIKPLIETPTDKRNSIALHIVLIKIIFVVLATIIIHLTGLLEHMTGFIIFLATLGSAWAFVDIYVELMPKRIYKQYFVIKAIVSLMALILKIVLIKLNVNVLYYFLTIEGLFPLLFLVFTHLNKNSYKNGIHIKYFKNVFYLIKHGAFIWLSSFLQIGGSRLLYLVINMLVSIKFSTFYYIFLRLTEGLMFIPNNICANFFKKIISTQQDKLEQQKLRYKMLKTCILSSFIVSPALFIVLFVYLKIKDITIDNYFLLLPIVIGVTVLSFIRIWISREIVINENLIASPFSYTCSFIFSIGSIYLLSDQGMWIILGLLVYYLMSAIIPFTIYSSRMASTLGLLKKLYHA